MLRSSNLVSHSSRIKVEKKVSRWTRHIPPFLDISGRDRTYPVQDETCPPDSFQPDVGLLFWPYFANWVSNWSHSFSAIFVTSRRSFLHYWFVCSSHSCRVLALWFWTWDIYRFLQKNLIQLPFTPLRSPCSVL
jgi:hypothetical protein